LVYSLASQPKQRRVQVIVWLILIVTIFGSIGGIGYYWYDYEKRSKSFDHLIAAAAERNGIDRLLVKAVIWQESRFNKDARGTHYELGLMQVVPGSAGAVQDWANAHHQKLPCKGVVIQPAMNIEIGSWYLARALNRWRDYKGALPLALCEYNAGITKAREWRPDNVDGEVLPRIKFASTRAYAEAIIGKYNELQEKREKNR